jgi:hypothetical protein
VRRPRLELLAAGHEGALSRVTVAARLLHGPRVRVAAGGPVGAGEAVAGSERVRGRRADDPFALGDSDTATLVEWIEGQLIHASSRRALVRRWA